MLPAIPVVLKTAATSIAKQAAVDAASGMLSGAAKKKLSKVTENNSDKQKLEREYSKNFKGLEEVDTSNNVMSIQDSFNSKLDSIVSTDPESSNLIKAVKDSNKATAELVSESLKETLKPPTIPNQPAHPTPPVLREQQSRFAGPAARL